MYFKRKRQFVLAIVAVIIISIYSVYTSASAFATAHIPTNLPVRYMQSLSGEWQFYWGRLLTPEDLAAPHSNELYRPSMIAVPESWRGQMLTISGADDPPLPSFGVATYRMQLSVPPEQVGKSLSLLLQHVGSAYRVWVNGVYVGGQGEVGTTADTTVVGHEIPMIRLQLIPVVLTDVNAEIVIQVSNFSFREAGIYGDVLIGDTQSITQYAFTRYVLNDLALAGILLAIGLYHLLVYLTSQRKQDVLLLGVLSTSMAIRAIAVNKTIATIVFAGLDWATIMNIQHAIKFVCLALIIQLNYLMIPQSFNALYHRVSLFVCGMGAAYLCLTPPSHFTMTLVEQTIVMSIITIYYVVVLVRAALRQHKRLIIWETVGLSLFLFAMINDVALAIFPFKSISLVSVATLIYLMMKSLISARQYVEIQHENNTLAQSLSVINQDLEGKIAERTHELHLSNEKLQELVQQRSHMMTNIAHDMGSPLIGVQSGLHVLADESLVPQEKAHVLTLLQNRAQYVQQLADDLFRLSKLQSSQFVFAWEYVAVPVLHTELSHYIQSIMDVDRTWIIVDDTCDVPTDDMLYVRVDYLQIKRVLHNLIDNALKYRKHNHDTITFRGSISMQAAGQALYQFEVVDQGIGIAPQYMTLIFERFHSIRRTETKSGHGLGLAIVKEIVHHHGGHVMVQSEVGVGSTFSVQLPIVSSDKVLFDDA